MEQILTVLAGQPNCGKLMRRVKTPLGSAL